MSAEATGWVWRYSPYRGGQLLVHLAIADVVNDVNDNEFWMSGTNLAIKAKVSRSTVTTTLKDLCDRGLMAMLESRAHIRQPSRFRMLMPTSALTALVESNQPGDNFSASATTALALARSARDTCALSARSSAISGSEHARSARANPKEITQENRSCFSTGEEQDQPTAPPPWTALGISKADWIAQGRDRDLEPVTR